MDEISRYETPLFELVIKQLPVSQADINELRTWFDLVLQSDKRASRSEPDGSAAPPRAVEE